MHATSVLCEHLIGYLVSFNTSWALCILLQSMVGFPPLRKGCTVEALTPTHRPGLVIVLLSTGVVCSFATN